MDGIALWFLCLIIFCTVAFFVVQILFLWSSYKTLKAAPKKFHLFPAWFIWLILIPFLGLVFAWIMIPFGVPKSLEAAADDNTEMKAAAKTLFGLGLALMILVSISIIEAAGYIIILASVIIWIIYWVKIVAFRDEFLMAPNSKKIKENHD